MSERRRPALRRWNFGVRRAVRGAIVRLRRLDPRRRVLPDFLIVGAQKAGTSSLYEYLAQHPSVRRALAKEIHYFDYGHGRGEGWYRAHFPVDEPGRRWLTGEASPSYLFEPDVPSRCAALLPGVRLIMLLRDPVYRAISHYHHARSLSLESRPIEDALLGPDAAQDRSRHRSYLARGRYLEQLRRWAEHYPRSAMSILPAEALFADPHALVARVGAFLGIGPGSGEGYERFKPGRYRPPEDRLIAGLREYFVPHNEALFAWLGERFSWT